MKINELPAIDVLQFLMLYNGQDQVLLNIMANFENPLVKIQRFIRIVRKGKDTDEVIPSKNIFKGSAIPRELQYG